jgi:hypothetical protein
MIETPGASALLTDTSSTLPPSATTPPAERETAFARLQELRRDPDFRAALIRGEADAVQKLHELRRSVSAPTALVINGQLTEGQVASALDRLQESGALSAAEVEQVRERTPVSAEEYKLAAQELARLKRDSEWVAKLHAGDQEARARWDRLHIIITSRIQS